jgi:hypothetical protein
VHKDTVCVENGAVQGRVRVVLRTVYLFSLSDLLGFLLATPSFQLQVYWAVVFQASDDLDGVREQSAGLSIDTDDDVTGLDGRVAERSGIHNSGWHLLQLLDARATVGGLHEVQPDAILALHNGSCHNPGATGS